MIYINKWNGRLGNNIHQLVNAYKLAEKYQCNVGYPNSNVYYPKPIFKPSPTVKDIKKSGLFFYRDKDDLKDIHISENDVRKICLNKVKQHIDIADIKIPDDVIILHVRNGDIFKINPHGGFVQPPMSFYTAIFDREGITDFSKIWVVCSNEQPFNPVIDGLRSFGCRIMIKDLKNSIDILSNAKTLISSRSSFAKYLFFLSLNAKKIYIPDFMVDIGIISGTVDDIEIIKVNLPDYIKIGSWSASPEQINLMLTYNINKITFNVL